MVWALHLEDMDAAVVRRIPRRHNDNHRHFPDGKFQALPRNGYTRVVSSAFDRLRVRETARNNFATPMLAHYVLCFNSMPIDEYFDFRGPLPYRLIHLHHQAAASCAASAIRRSI